MTGGTAVALAAVGIDDVARPDGSGARGVLGGAGTFAALGLALTAAAPVGVVSGVGSDFPFHAWFDEWGIDTAALRVVSPRTYVSELVYDALEERSEVVRDHPEAFAKALPQPDDVPPAWRPAGAVYVLHGTSQAYWEAVAPLRTEGAVLLWELLGEAAQAEAWPAVRERLGDVDVFSLNRSEARRLLGTDDPERCADALLEAGCPHVALRLGAAGSMHATPAERVWIPAALRSDVRDPTGGGNTYCGAFLGAFAADPHVQRAATAAAAAASVALEQFGPPPPSARQRFHERLARMSAAAGLDTQEGTPE